MRDSLLQVVIATGDGRLVTAGGRTVEGVSGFDLCRLSVGSLGTLGVIVQATLKLWPIPSEQGWFGMEAPLDERLGAGERALTGPGRPASVLLAPGRVAVELAGPAADVRPPEGMAPLPAAPARPRDGASWRRASRRPAWATSPPASRAPAWTTRPGSGWAPA